MDTIENRMKEYERINQNNRSRRNINTTNTSIINENINTTNASMNENINRKERKVD